MSRALNTTRFAVTPESRHSTFLFDRDPPQPCRFIHAEEYARDPNVAGRRVHCGT